MPKTDEFELLNEIMARPGEPADARPRTRDRRLAEQNLEPAKEVKLTGLCQWTTSNGKTFVPASTTTPRLTPGVYEIRESHTVGIYFEKTPVLAKGLVRFPQTNSDVVLEEIQKFWTKGAVFSEYKLAYRRGIILWGPPGSGKSSLIQLIMQDVVERDGIVIKFCHPHTFNEGMRIFREIEPETPVVVLMEDIDSILKSYDESEVLNILDGVNQIHKALFLATTNFPEDLGPRIINRPSRFDKRFMIGHPDEESRRIYFKYIIGEQKIKSLGIDLERWVRDTDKFSIAHLKELFTAVVILGNDYADAVRTLKSMRLDRISSENDEPRRRIGLNAGRD